LFFYFDKTIIQSFAVKNLYFYKNSISATMEAVITITST